MVVVVVVVVVRAALIAKGIVALDQTHIKMAVAVVVGQGWCISIQERGGIYGSLMIPPPPPQPLPLPLPPQQQR